VSAYWRQSSDFELFRLDFSKQEKRYRLATMTRFLGGKYCVDKVKILQRLREARTVGTMHGLLLFHLHKLFVGHFAQLKPSADPGT